MHAQNTYFDLIFYFKLIQQLHFDSGTLHRQTMPGEFHEKNFMIALPLKCRQKKKFSENVDNIFETVSRITQPQRFIQKNLTVTFFSELEHSFGRPCRVNS
jgi:hypothetical protein